MDSKYAIFWLLVPLVLIGLLMLAWSNTPDIVTGDNNQALGFYQFDHPKELAEFSLQDHLGQPVDRTSLVGRVSLIFFGFTFCPDVCPTTLSILNMATENLTEPPQVVLASVDPARDTPAVLAPYVTGFNQSFTGYTGSVDDVTAFAAQLDAAFVKIFNPGNNGNYTVDHSANIMVINKQGDYQGFIRPPFDVSKVKAILELLRRE